MADSLANATKKINQKWKDLKKRRLNLGRKKGKIVKAKYGGWYQVYEKGRIYSHHTVGTYEVHGNNLRHYIKRKEFDHNPVMGRREFGFPKADEGRTPDRLYAMSQFEWGQIIAFPGTSGGVSISGDIYKQWMGMGAGRSSLGYPINSNVRVAGGEAVFFERGCLFFNKRKSKSAFTINVLPPLLGNASIIKPTDKLIGFTATLGGTATLKRIGEFRVLVSILSNRYYLQEVGTNRRILLNLNKSIRRTARKVTVNLSIPQDQTLKDRTLYNIVFRMDNGRYYPLSPHAVYVKNSWKDFGLIHATDIHVAKRIDGFKTKLIRARDSYDRKDLNAAINKHFNNWNDRFRDLIRYANFLHRKGKLDAIIATGDIVDYQFEERDNQQGGGNFEFFKKLILGKVKYPHKSETQEELKVPIFTSLGNHDYRPNPYKLLAELSTLWGAIDLKTIKQFGGYNINENEARAIQDGRPNKKIRLSNGLTYEKKYGKPEISSGDAKKMVAIKTPTYYFKHINRDPSYMVTLGDNRLLMLDAGPDKGLPDGIWDIIMTYTGFASEDMETVVKHGSPNTKGLKRRDLNLVANALHNASGAVIIGTHSPPISPHGNEYPHYFRETEHPSANEKETANYLRRRKVFPPLGGQPTPTNDQIVKLAKKRFKDWPLNRTRYFKKGDHNNFLDYGVSRGEIEMFLKLCTNAVKSYGRYQIKRPVDLILFGHVHTRAEIRMKWNARSKTQEYYFDYFTENPRKYYSSRKIKNNYGGTNRVYIQVQAGARANGRPRKSGKKLILKVPPYVNPLSHSDNPKKWWQQHRPLFIQGAPSGPVDNSTRSSSADPNFQGVKLITVSDNVIQKVKQVSASYIERAVPPPSSPSGIPVFKDNLIQPNAIIRLFPKHVGGDREFGGNGPKVKATCQIAVSRDKKSLQAKLFLHAKETKRDWTEAKGSWTKNIYKVPKGYIINKVYGSSRSEVNYIDNDHQVDVVRPRGSGPVNHFKIMGDSKGNDVGNRTIDDVYMEVYFNKIKVKLQLESSLTKVATIKMS